MKKKLLIAFGILVVLIVVAMLYLNRNRTLSPPGDTSAKGGGLSVAVTYSRPSVRERLLFGEKEEGALQPYGFYWRLGANEPTDIEVDNDFVFGGTKIPAGKYVIYAIPRKGEMELRLSSDLRMWGYSEPDYSKDLAVAIVRIQTSTHTEQFTIEANPSDNGVMLDFSWGTTSWQLLIVGQ